MGSPVYADVIIDISHEKVDRTFQYRIPEHLKEQVLVGVQVSVPFGNGNTVRKGYVVGVSGTPGFDTKRIKEIAGIETGTVSVQSQLIKLAWWMRRTYGSTMNQALKTVLPVKQKVKAKEKRFYRCLLSEEELREQAAQAERKGYKARVRLLNAFFLSAVIPAEAVEQQLAVSPASIRPLVEQGILAVDSHTVSRAPARPAAEMKKAALLNEEQKAAASCFISDYKEGVRKTYLLHGITGSGKTEVYMEMMEHVLSQGKQVILLIPEISLTYQTVMRFYGRFGEQLAVINSRLSAGERYDQWSRAIKGEVSIMIGPRSALFAPFPALGLIIMDEEHEGAYKSETMPRYHARDTAAARAEIANASLVLGSATPSLEAYTRALSGEYSLLTLTKRAAKDSRLAAVEIVDLREELKAGNKSMFSRRLGELIGDRLEKKEQVMLFINRRGYSNFVSCRSCGEAVKCPHCDVSLTLHRDRILRCHYCGFSIPVMTRCPSCASPYIADFGVGTQKLEAMTKSMFPHARVLRMDADTTSKKESHQEILSAFAAGEADILIGTQMIVKGHDFEGVTLVGIMAADLSLNTPDYRCAERTFELLTQAAGRSGRGSREGRVVIQTYAPEHYSIQAAARQDYAGFYSQEMVFRRMMSYPPVCRMQMVIFACSDERAAAACAEAACRAAQRVSGQMEEERPEAERRAVGDRRNQVRMIGPINAPVHKVNDIYRKILYIKSENCVILDKIRDTIEALISDCEDFRRVSVQFDIS